jgi:2,4-dichlorophenol 6-monooxygenase
MLADLYAGRIDVRVIEVPILIVGGGGAGLTASNILADLGVASLLVERHPQTSHLPKAHYLNQRSMEIFRHHGLDEAIYAKGAPPEHMQKITWHTSLGGNGPMDRVVIKEVDAMGGGRYAAPHALKGVSRSVNIPQIRLEPVLRKFAEERNPGRVLFRHELRTFKETRDGVEAVIRDLENNDDLLVRARYLVAADAGKTIGPALGIKMVGPSALGDYVMIYMKADLSKFIPDDRAVMRVICHVDQRGGTNPVGGLLALGPSRWDRHSEEWGIGWGYAADDPERNNEDRMEQRIQQFLKVDVPIEVKRISHWSLEAIIADKFRIGPAFVVGDAAHKHTPGGGLGLNSAIQDVHNLCWKLALVIQGRAADSLLDSYEPERRPVVGRNAENSLLAFANHFTLMTAMGLVAGASKEQNEASFIKLLADTPDGAQRRARLDAVFDATIGSEYAPHDLEMGFQYADGAIVDDGTPWPPRDPLGCVYTPSSHPGCRLPHVWLHKDGEGISTHDLIPRGGFLLLTGSDGDLWHAAAQRIAAARGLTIHAYRICERGGVVDTSDNWKRLSEIAGDGALLVRPDGHVGFRSRSGANDCLAVLESALAQILSPKIVVKCSRRLETDQVTQGEIEN